ncbi:fibrinogen C domain-containing protein 1 [Elysia marginata]|uniref:Fibrinogen C domain-containing protein 1 n=1 Tax=Elysia marginata TaxID=1093978 RepID=A0AAV4HWI6_9GAST|nr:fibrinogen C domain-containing protein 1 [Elysia marginata]
MTQNLICNTLRVKENKSETSSVLPFCLKLLGKTRLLTKRFLLSRCQWGLELTLAPTDRNVAGTSDSCGVLLCKTSSVRDDKQRNINSLSLYKVVSQGPTGSDSSKPGILSSLAFVSTSQPSFEQFSNGVKVSGSLNNEQASLRVELFKQTDCLTEYTCELQEVDSEGKKLITSHRLLQTQVQKNDNELNKDLTSSLFTRLYSLVQGLDIKLTTNELYLKDKLNSVEDRTFDLQKEITENIHNKLASVEKSSERMESRLNSIENRVTNFRIQFTDKIYSLENQLQNKVSTNFQNIEDKLCDLETKLTAIDSEAIQQKILNSIETRVDAHFTKVLNASDRAEETLNKTANLLAALKDDNTNFRNEIMIRYKNLFDNVSKGMDGVFLRNGNFQNDIIKSYKNLFGNVSKGMDEIFLQNGNLTQTIKNSLYYFNNNLHLSLDRMESTTNNSVAKTLTSLRALEAQLDSSIAGEIQSALVVFFLPQTCQKNLPVLIQRLSTPYPVVYESSTPGLSTPILCDTITDHGGWIVIQRRSTGDVDFFRGWASYKKGFGALHTDFWLGLENIHAITSSGKYELRVDLEYQGQSKYAVYDRFSLAGKDKNYKITLGSYSGTAGDSLEYHNGMQFSTYDRDNDRISIGCAKKFRGAWWHKGCHNSNLNGEWQAVGDKGPRWAMFTGKDPASFTELKIRRVGD